MLRVTPLYGSSSSSSVEHVVGNSGCSSTSTTGAADADGPSSSLAAPPASCTLVEYGGVRLLLNVGWDESLPLPSSSAAASTDGAAEEEKKVDEEEDGVNGAGRLPPLDLPDDVDAILITDSTLCALGGLPLYLGSRSSRTNNRNRNRSTRPPIYGTYPTVKMGQMTLYDHHASLSLDGSTPGYTLEDVDDVLSVHGANAAFKTLKYSQTVTISDSNTGQPAVTVTPHRSGVVVGASFWVLKRLADETEVVLAPSYHHAKERHLDSCTLHKFGAAADVLITRPGGPSGLLGSLYAAPEGGGKPILPPPLVNRSEGEMIELVMAALRRDGNVLMPVDASGRILELVLVLERHWDRQRLSGTYNLCWVGPLALNTIEFARSQLEWMAGPLGARFDTQRGHPYSFKSVRICSSIAELDAVIEASGGNPTVVLASGPTLDHGPARDLLLQWADNPDNAVILTDSSRCTDRGDVLWTRLQKRRGRSDAAKTKGTAAGTVGGAGGGVTTSTSAAAPGGAPVATTTATATPGETDAAAAADDDEATDLVGTALPSTSDGPSHRCTAAQLLWEWCKAKADRREMADVIDVDVLVPRRAPLGGDALRAFLAGEEAARREKKAEEERRAMLREVELAKGRLRLGEEEGGGAASTPEGGGGGKAQGASSTGGGSAAGAGASLSKGGGKAGQPPPKKKSRFDSNLFLKFSKPVHMTFEVREEAVGIGQSDSIAKYGIGESIGRSGEVLEDDYGIAVMPERFIDIVTGIDPSKFAGGSGRIGDEVLKRGLGFGADGRPVLASSGGLPVALRPGGSENVNKQGETGDGGEDELALEAADLSEGKGIIRGRNGRPPIKVSTIPRRLEVLAEIAYVSLEGRVDARAARQSVRALQPRQVVILGGRGRRGDGKISGEAGLLADAVRSLTIGKYKGESIFAPNDRETVELSVGHAAYAVRLIDTPYMTSEEKEAVLASGEDIPTTETHEAKMGESTVSLLDCIATGKKWAVDSSIVLAPRLPQEHDKHRNVMLSDGDVLLTDLRSEIIAQGMKAEYSAHTGYSQLIVNSKVIVQKDQETGKIHVEGPLCEDFYTVRSVVMGQYVTL